MSNAYVGNSGGGSPSTDLHTARFIVGDISNGANYSTIASALAAASSGDTIFLQTGTYTEDLTLKAGVNLCGFTGDDSLYKKSSQFNCQIIGKLSASFSGLATVNNICLTTNGDNCVNVSGAATKLILNNCFINVKDDVYGIVATNVTNDFVMNFCYGATNSANAAFFHTSVDVIMNYCAFYIDSSPSAASLISGGNFQVQYSSITSNITVSSGTLDAQDCFFANVTTSGGVVSMTNCQMGILTLGTSGTSLATLCEFGGGASAAITVGAGTTLDLYGCTIISSATNVITGAGTLNYGDLTFPGSSQGVNVTTMNGGFLPLSNGTSGQVWTSNGANVPATFQTAPASASMGPYIVGTELANYSTIQAAINAANATGHYSSAHPVDVVVKPKADSTYYVENLVLYDGINIVALATNSYPGISQDFQNSVVIHGTLAAPLTDQSLTRIVNIQIQTPAASTFIDFPGVGTTNEVDFVGCQVVPAANQPMVTASSNSGGESFVSFDNCNIEGTLAQITNDGSGEGYLIEINFNNTHAVIAGTTTITLSQVTLIAYNSDLYMNYAGSSSATMNITMHGCAGDGFRTDSFVSTNWDVGGSIDFNECPVKGAFSLDGGTPTIGLANFYNCDMFNNFISPSVTTFTGNCPPALFDCPNSCGYNSVQAVKTTTYTALVTDSVIPCDTSGGAFTVSLYATPFLGMTQTVVDSTQSATVNNITVSGNGNNINGAATATIALNNGSLRCCWTGTQWNTI